MLCFHILLDAGKEHSLMEHILHLFAPEGINRFYVVGGLLIQLILKFREETS